MHGSWVTFGACGYEELAKFAQAPSLQGYQLLVIDETRSYRVDAFGPPKDKQSVLLYNQQHYDVVTSLPGFFGTSYFCGRCLKPCDNEGQHLARIILTTVQPVYRMSALITAKPNLNIA